MIMEIIEFVVDQAELKGELPAGKNRFIEVFMPKISMRDLQRLTQSLRNLGGFINSVDKAESAITLEEKDKDRLKEVMHTLLDHIDRSSGVSMENDEMMDVVTGNSASDEERLSFMTNGQSNGNNNEEEALKLFNDEKFDIEDIVLPDYIASSVKDEENG